MPLLRLQTSAPVADAQRQPLLAALSRTVAECIGKPERYVMITLEESALMLAGQEDLTAFADVRSIGGLNGSVNKQITQRVCNLLNEFLGISPDRVYLNFSNIAADHWGWNNSTFG